MSKGQHRPKVNNFGWIPKIVNFHSIDLKFEEELQIWVFNSTNNCFWRQNCFLDFCKCRALHDVFLLFCRSVFISPTGHNSKPIIMKLYQIVEVVSTEKSIDFEVKGHLEVKFLKSSFFIQLTWKLNKICILCHWFGKLTIFEVKVSKVNSRSNF